MKQISGFTLVELIVVIVVLGILGATAIPKMLNLGKDARLRALDGVDQSLRASISKVRTAYVYAGNNAALTATLPDGTVVSVAAATGFPAPTQAGFGTLMGCTNGVCRDGIRVVGLGASSLQSTWTPPNVQANCAIQILSTAVSASQITRIETGC